MSKFVEFHKFLESPEAHPMLEEIEGHRRSRSSIRFMEAIQGDSSDEEASSTSEMPGGNFSLPPQAIGEIKQLKALITRVKKRKELTFLIDAQIFTEVLRPQPPRSPAPPAAQPQRLPLQSQRSLEPPLRPGLPSPVRRGEAHQGMGGSRQSQCGLPAAQEGGKCNCGQSNEGLGRLV